MEPLALSAATVGDLAAFIEDRVMIVPWSGCWLWERAVGSHGYGQHRVPGTARVTYAHRTSYEAFVGPISPGMHVCHKCDIPTCCNPDHLWLGTNAENVADRDAKGRCPHGELHASAKLRESDVVVILDRLKSGESLSQLAREYGVGVTTIHRIKSGSSWRHVPRPDRGAP